MISLEFRTKHFHHGLLVMGAVLAGAACGCDGDAGATVTGPAVGGALSTGGKAFGSAGGESSGGGNSGGASAPVIAPAVTGGNSDAGLAPDGENSSGGAAVTGGQGAGGLNLTGGEGSGGAPPTGGVEGGPLCNVGVWDRDVPEVLSLTGNTHAHDPTMVKVDGTYYRFWTGGHIPSATSPDLMHWSDAPTVYDRNYPAWVTNWLEGVPGQTFNFPWAPDVIRWGGQVHLYASFSARFGANISCISHLSTSDIKSGIWQDHGPVICTDGTQPYNAIDADVGLDADGTPFLAFGSFWDGIMAFELNADGSRKGDGLTQLAWATQIEAPVLFHRCGYHYLFVTWGLCCPGEGRSVDDLTYRVVVGRSDNILGPYLDRDGVPMLDGGGTLVVQGDGVTWAAAGHSDVLIDEHSIYHLYHAYRQDSGGAELRISELLFDDEGWPVPHPP